MKSSGKYFFVSDVHLGAAFCDRESLERKFVALLDHIASEKAEAVYLLGDIFDFWYEYRYVIPRGYTRALGALARLCDSGVKVYFIRGNHDVWVYGYFEKELGMKVLEQPAVVEIDGKLFCLGHGDGLGRTETAFKFIRWAFHNRFLQVLFSALHPRWAFGLGYAWAGHSRKMKNDPSKNGRFVFRGEEEPLFRYAEQFGPDYSRCHHGRGIDYYIFGHYHTPGRIKIPSGGEMCILGCWVDGGEYAVYGNGTLDVISAESPASTL